jgi:hypothetical protein
MVNDNHTTFLPLTGLKMTDTSRITTHVVAVKKT